MVLKLFSKFLFIFKFISFLFLSFITFGLGLNLSFWLFISLVISVLYFLIFLLVINFCLFSLDNLLLFSLRYPKLISFSIALSNTIILSHKKFFLQLPHPHFTFSGLKIFLHLLHTTTYLVCK